MSRSRLSHAPASDAARLRAKKFREDTLNGDLYAMYSLKTILANMRTLGGEERVYWGWVRYSWCYPISLPYAVQIDADGNPIWDGHTARWLPMSQKLLAKIMGVDQGYLCRATGALVAAGRLEVDDGAVYVRLEPEPIDAEGRTDGEAGYDCTVIWGIPLGDLPTLPKPVLNTLARTFESAQVPLGERRLELAKPFFETRRKLLDEWNQLRETEAFSYAKHVAQLQLDLGLEPELAAKNGGSNGAAGQKQDSKETAGTFSKADNSVRNEELYEAGSGKGALAKLDRPRSLPAAEHPAFAATLLLGLADRGLAVELAFAERLAREMSPCESPEFFFQVLDNDRAANARVHKPFTTTLLPSVAQSVAIKYRDKAKAERQEGERVEGVRKKEHARNVAQWKDAYRTANPEDRALYAELLEEAGVDVPELGAGV